VKYQDFFPFTLQCNDKHGFAENPSEFREVFAATRPKDMFWYGYDVTIKSPSEITFHVREMEDSFFGGIGAVIHSFDVRVARDVTQVAIYNRARKFAKWKRERELEEAEESIMASYTTRILDELPRF